MICMHNIELPTMMSAFNNFRRTVITEYHNISTFELSYPSLLPKQAYLQIHHYSTQRQQYDYLHGLFHRNQSQCTSTCFNYQQSMCFYIYDNTLHKISHYSNWADQKKKKSLQFLTLIYPPQYEDVQCQSRVNHIHEG